MLLTSETVESIFMKCLFTTEEVSNTTLVGTAVRVTGIVNQFGFHPVRIKEHADEIRDLLLQLPNGFREGTEENGLSFLCAFEDNKGHHWGEHRNMEQLLCLGMANNQVINLTPNRQTWAILPGGVPYFLIKTPNITEPI